MSPYIRTLEKEIDVKNKMLKLQRSNIDYVRRPRMLK